MFPLKAELNRSAEWMSSIDFIFSLMVLNIHCPEILLKSEEVRQPAPYLGWKEEGS